MNECAFCTLPRERVAASSEHGVVIRDAYPISDGHTLIIPKRHIGSFFDLSSAELSDLFALLNNAKTNLDRDLSPDGYNVGINDGPVAGQIGSRLASDSLSPYRRQYQRAARQGPVLPRLLLSAGISHHLIPHLTQYYCNILRGIDVLQQGFCEW